MDIGRAERGRTGVEEVIKTKDAISLWVHLFEGCGNNKTGTVERAEGQHFPQREGAKVCFEQGDKGKDSKRLRMQRILVLDYKY